MGCQLASLYQETEMEFKFCELSTDAQWGIRLGKLGVSILCSATKFYPFWYLPSWEIENRDLIVLYFWGEDIYTDSNFS